MTAVDSEGEQKRNYIFWLMISKPQPKVYSDDICLGPEGVP